MKVVIVGNGRSVYKQPNGHAIDSYETVVRMKRATIDAPYTGSRTDYICSRVPEHRQEGVGFWLYPKRPGMAGNVDYARWSSYFRRFSTNKPSTGLCTVFAAVQHLEPVEIALIGFDFVLWGAPLWRHDAAGERRALEGLGIPIVDLFRECCGSSSDARA